MNMKKDKNRSCPVCGEGHLESRTAEEEVEYRGQTRALPLHFSVCDQCESEIAGKEESRSNKRVMNAFKKEVDGLVAGSRIRHFRRQFGLTQKLLADILGGGEIAFSRYESDDVMQSKPMDALLRLCESSPTNLVVLADQKKIHIPSEIVQKILKKGKGSDVYFVSTRNSQLQVSETDQPEQPEP